MTTHHGRGVDRGRIRVGHEYPGEGYAVIRCGNTEVRLGYTLLHDVRIQIDAESHYFGQLVELQQALHSITAEASMGRTGDDERPEPLPDQYVLTLYFRCDHCGNMVEARHVPPDGDVGLEGSECVYLSNCPVVGTLLNRVEP